jgi:hypothetical protein
MGLGRSWLEPRVQGLGEAQAAGAKLALLTALAPSQMSDGIIDDCKRYFDDRTIIVIVSWAAYTASRRVAGWLAEKSGHFDQEQFLKAG